jgi:hypothetical protein
MTDSRLIIHYSLLIIHSFQCIYVYNMEVMKPVTLRTSLAGGYFACTWCRAAVCMNKRAAQKIDNGQKCLGFCNAHHCSVHMHTFRSLSDISDQILFYCFVRDSSVLCF